MLVDILVDKLTKNFESKEGLVRALRSINLHITEGSLTVLLGPSGCGKTTLLRCIAGLEAPSSGSIAIGETAVFDSDRRRNLPPDQRRLGMVFQSYALWPHLTVHDNVAYPLKRSRVSRKEIGSRVAEMLRLVDCAKLASRFPGELSGGQQQRIALARAMVAHPEVLLFDEPLSNLDAGLRVRMRTEVKRLQRQSGITAIYVTHDQEEALALADHLVVMNEGQILQQGAAEEVYHGPTTDTVARFVGAANVFSVTEIINEREVLTPIGKVSVEQPIGTRDSQEDSLSLMVRQEHVRIVETDDDVPEGHSNVFDAAPINQEFQGTFRLTRVKIGSVELVARVSVDQIAASGRQCKVFLPPEHCRVVSNLDDKNGTA